MFLPIHREQGEQKNKPNTNKEGFKLTQNANILQNSYPVSSETQYYKKTNKSNQIICYDIRRKNILN